MAHGLAVLAQEQVYLLLHGRVEEFGGACDGVSGAVAVAT
jgi:hypothetical protein